MAYIYNKKKFLSLPEQVVQNKKDIKNIKNKLNEVIEDLVENLIKITWEDLVDLRDNGELIPGAFYRIIDYETTAIQANTGVYKHYFDIIVLALSENILSEVAGALERKGETYFINSELHNWQIWYKLDNIEGDLGWTTKGYIYRMIDEHGNDLTYDFKNIYIIRDGISYYTFDFNQVDATLDKNVKNNVFKYTSQSTIFKNVENVYDNFIDEGAEFNVIGNEFYNNKIGKVFRENSIDVKFTNNTFGNNFEENVFNLEVKENIVGNDFKLNVFSEGMVNNKIGNNTITNIIKKPFLNNNIGNDFKQNNINSQFYENNIGNDFRMNHIWWGRFYKNKIGNDFRGNDFSSQTLSSYNREFSNNKIGNDFKDNMLFPNSFPSFDLTFSNNIIQDGAELWEIQKSFINNYIYNNVKFLGASEVGGDITFKNLVIYHWSSFYTELKNEFANSSSIRYIFNREHGTYMQMYCVAKWNGSNQWIWDMGNVR